MHRLMPAIVSGLVLGLLMASRADAQHQPFVVHDTKPVITHGPYLVDPSETAVTVVWTTDTPSHARVIFGSGESLDRHAEAARHGMLPVGTLHAIRISGLEPGRTYRYQAVSTRVVRLKAYWPEKGLAVESAVGTFTTLDRRKPSVSFSVVTDTHEDVPRIDALMKAIDWPSTDFFVHVGDAFHSVESEDQLFAKWLDPVARGLAGRTAMIYARGNHEMRGAFARSVFDYVPSEEGRFYYARDHGPLHLLVLDTGEDKPDDTNVYARLNRSEPYLAEEIAWVRAHAQSTPRHPEAPFRVVLMHQPGWQGLANGAATWTAVASDARADLVIAGHRHRYSRVDAGTGGATFTTLVLGQDQIARVDATPDTLTVTVRSASGEPIDAFVLRRRSR